MHPKISENLPIYAHGELNFQRLNELIGTSNEITAEILGVSEGTIRSVKISHATLRKSQILIHILNMLWTLTDGKTKEVKRWLYEPRIEWKGKAPMDLLTSQKAEVVANYLEGLLDGEVIGS